MPDTNPQVQLEALDNAVKVSRAKLDAWRAACEVLTHKGLSKKEKQARIKDAGLPFEPKDLIEMGAREAQKKIGGAMRALRRNLRSKHVEAEQLRGDLVSQAPEMEHFNNGTFRITSKAGHYYVAIDGALNKNMRNLLLRHNYRPPEGGGEQWGRPVSSAAGRELNALISALVLSETPAQQPPAHGPDPTPAGMAGAP